MAPNLTPTPAAKAKAAPASAHPAAACHLITAKPTSHLLTLLQSLQKHPEGWQIITLKPQGSSFKDWQDPSRQAVIRAAIENTLLLQRSCMLHLFPQGHLVLVAHVGDAEAAAVIHQLLQLLGNGKGEQQIFTLPHHTPAAIQWAENQHQTYLQTLQTEHTQHQISLAKALTFKLDSREAATRITRTTPIVLVVEDDPSTAMLLEHLIGGEAKVFIANNAQNAVEHYIQHAPNLVFLDIGLPDVNGLTLLSKITAADNATHVVMLTANAYAQNIAAAKQAGAKGFLAKPFTRDKLLQAITAATSPKPAIS